MLNGGVELMTAQSINFIYLFNYQNLQSQLEDYAHECTELRATAFQLWGC